LGADGLGTKVNEEGITFYNNVINALLDRGIVCIKQILP
jgi:beta-glucosidase